VIGPSNKRLSYGRRCHPQMSEGRRMLVTEMIAIPNGDASGGNGEEESWPLVVGGKEWGIRQTWVFFYRQ
jgi:hypothetical protein